MSKRRQASVQGAASALAVVHPQAGGIDIGASEIYVCVPRGCEAQPVRTFPSFTVDLYRLAEWLAACGVTTVAMESTGVYWVPLYEILEARDIEVYLVNSQHLKRVPGRKSDVSDCQWLQQLHTYGLLQASFRPAAEVCGLRTLVRQREMLVRYRAMHIQHMQKALTLMNLRLTEVLNDITGITGLSIIRTLVAGEQDPHRLARLRDPRCAHSEAEIAKALTGHYQAEQLFALRQALEAYDFYDTQLRACDAEIERLYDTLPPLPPPEEAPPPQPETRQRRKNQAYFDLTRTLYQWVGVDLTAIDGVDALTIQTVLSEIGLDMSRWPTVKHFTSWLGLAPKPEKSGGKVLRTYRPKTKQRANTALRLAAQSLARSQTGLGAFYRRLKARYGPAVANVATAHKLARIIYAMLKHRQPYHDPGPTYYEQQFRERSLRHLQRKAVEFGMTLVPTSPPPEPQVS
jgi:transposase